MTSTKSGPTEVGVYVLEIITSGRYEPFVETWPYWYTVAWVGEEGSTLEIELHIKEMEPWEEGVYVDGVTVELTKEDYNLILPVARKVARKLLATGADDGGAPVQEGSSKYLSHIKAAFPLED